ncbi:hypothetical protein SADUNF_Sadunf15G0042000 [Salix dunnii]|uniref:CRAL-TRIO domain-containing protein n=1 Tax=Salix dunnii TaxID=1413687 RepID=A0A835JFK5_9ROSI|nr:hypothetical protein SADUNF_Sadunf15G0042000 [Salix dunnii]
MELFCLRTNKNSSLPIATLYLHTTSDPILPISFDPPPPHRSFRHPKPPKSKAKERRLSKETTKDKETRSEQQDSMKNNWMEQAKIPQVRAIVERQDPSSKVVVLLLLLFVHDIPNFSRVELAEATIVLPLTVIICDSWQEGSIYMLCLIFLRVQEVDDPTIRRFLRACGLDIEKASSMLLRFLKWRREFVPNGSISLLETPNEAAQNKMFKQGSDKKGRPITIILGARHFQSKGSLEEFKRFVVYGFDKICSRMPPVQEKFVVIGDLEGWGYAKSDIHGYLGGLSILQEYYPERLAKLFLVHAPSIFMAVWKIVYPFIDKNTRKKVKYWHSSCFPFTKNGSYPCNQLNNLSSCISSQIVFVDSSKLKSTLLEEIDQSQIPDIYGGDLPLIPIHESK